MSKLELLAVQVVAVMVGLGVFFSFLIGAIVSQGGEIHLTMMVFNEMWPEYWLMFLSVGIIPWALWYLTECE